MAHSVEADLAARLCAGEPGALDEAYRLHASHCRAVAHRVLRDVSLAQDAVQEAFLSLWRHRDGLVVRTAGIRPWLVVVARNAALNIARGSARRAARELAAASPDEADPFSALEAGADSAEVRQAVMELPEEQRTVIAMAYFGRKTLAQIAELTRSPLGTVKRRAQLALRRLGTSLGGSPR